MTRLAAREGRGLLRAILDWFSIRGVGQVRSAQLFELASIHLPAMSKGKFEQALSWALEATRGTCEGDVVQLTTSMASRAAELLEGSGEVIEEPSDAAWLTTIAHTTPEEAVSLGLSALARGRTRPAEAAFRRAVGSAHPETAVGAAINLASSLMDQGRFDDAIDATDSVLERRAQLIETVPSLVATVLYNRAVAQREAGDPDSASATFDDVISTFVDAEDRATLKMVANAVVNQGALYVRAEDPGSTVSVSEEWLRRAVRAPDLLALSESYQVLANLAWALLSLERPEEAIEISRAVRAEFPNQREPRADAAVGRLRYIEARALERLGREDEAMEAYREVPRLAGIARAGDVEDVLRLAEARLRELELQRNEREMIALDAVLAGPAEGPQARLKAVQAMVNRGVVLARTDRLTESVELYDELIATYGKDADAGIRVQVAMATFNRANDLLRMDDLDGARKGYDQLIVSYGDEAIPGLQYQVAQALLNLGVVTQRADGAEASVQAFEHVRDRYRTSSDPRLRRIAALGGRNVVGVLLGQGSFDEALRALHDLTTAFGDDGPTVLELVISSVLNTAAGLSGAGRDEVAAALLRAAVERYETHEADRVRELAEGARQMLGIVEGP